MNTGCFKCDKAQWDADGCTCEITGLLVGNAERGCEFRKDIELKPCPFCGSKNVRVAENRMDYLFIGYSIHCNGCGVETSYTKDKDKAIEKWNRRVEDIQPVKRGRWIWNSEPELGNPYGSYRCSECGNRMKFQEIYCCGCGARMAEEDENETD